MKVAFWVVCVLASVLGMSASCGPQKPFCPDRDWDEFNCAVESDAGSIGGNGGQGGGSACPDGFEFRLVDGSFMCVAAGT